MNIYTKLFDYCIQEASLESDTQQIKIKKAFVLLLPLVLGVLGIVWSILYLSFGALVPAIFPLLFSINAVISFYYLKKTKNINTFRNIQIVVLLFIPFLLMWSLGGFVNGSFVMIWAFFAPVGALVYNNKQSLWFYLFLILLVVSIFIDKHLSSSYVSTLPQIAIDILLIMNLLTGLTGLYLLIKHFIKEQDESAHKILQEQHEKLQERTEEFIEANIKLHHLANHDSLTNVSNRYNFRKLLDLKIKSSQSKQRSIALLFIDLDNFKYVNDTFGHNIGDELLVEVSNRIKSVLRDEDTIARIGGDEFSVVLNNVTDSKYIETISLRIISEINRDYDFIDTSSPVGASIGISMFPKDAQDIDTLINYADEAMYRIKKNSKNAFRFYSTD
ncbi:GGDEF domain-containing protein [Sulfurimonas sp.]|nr:GGDEF domain-containing protein [Sulfurimonas sp.]